MFVNAGQSSYDPRFIRKLFPEFETYKHSALAQLFDVDLSKLDDLPEEKYRLFEEVSALPHLTKDDAPAALFYGSKLDTPITSQGIGIHHPRFGKALKGRELRAARQRNRRVEIVFKNGPKEIAEYGLLFK